MATNLKRYKEYHRSLLFDPSNKSKFLKELSMVVSIGDTVNVKILLDILKKEGQTQLLATYQELGEESMLHIAAKFNQTSDIIEILIKFCPELLIATRKESEDYYGLSALHIAVVKGNTAAVNVMLVAEFLKHRQTTKVRLLHQLATGVKFSNTVMMGELPLSVAALTFNCDMIEILLENGAEMDRKNTKGDTVFHSLIRFAAIYPEQTTQVLQTLDYFHNKIKEKSQSKVGDTILSMEYDHSNITYIWFMTNNDDLNPLQLSTSLSQPTIFDFILNLPQVYCFLNNHDGLFDRKLYDITEIDTNTTEKWVSHQKSRQHRLQRHIAPTDADGVSKHKFSNKSNSCSPFDICRRESRKSLLEMMFDIKSSAAFSFIQISTVRHIIKTKWVYYRVFYYSWMMLHLLFMVTLTVYAVMQADNYDKVVTTSGVSVVHVQPNAASKRFLDVFSYMYLVVGVFFCFVELYHIMFRVKSFDIVQLLNVLHNASYRVILTLFSLSMITEFILSRALNYYENYTLILALILGWWFFVFFLRAHKKFSFFTVMIQKVIMGDMLRFAVIIALALVSFTAGIYMTFSGSAVIDEDLESYGTTMMLLFKLMIGLGEMDKLYAARQPWLAVTLFIWFVLLTYVLMFNTLIAMMSQTCSLVSENRHVQWRVQQLSVIMFFEDALPACLKKMVGTEKDVRRFDPNLKQVVNEKRYFLDMSSMQTEYASTEDIYAMKCKRQTLIDGTHSQYQDFNLTIPTQHFASPRYRRVQYFDEPVDFPRYREITVLPTSDDNHVNGIHRSPSLRRRASKREESDVTKLLPDIQNGTVNARASGRQKKKKNKKRIDPAVDVNEYDDNNSGVNKFYPNHDYINNNMPTPTPLRQPLANGNVPRQRHQSENGLVDTHIGEQQQQHPVKRVQLPMEQVSQMAHREQNAGSLDIGLISDSYM